MFSLFKRKKISINSISIPDFGWQVCENKPDTKIWVNCEKESELSLFYYEGRSDWPSLDDIDAFRKAYRNLIADNNGGLIEVDKVNIKGYKVIKAICKFPQEPFGMIYLAFVNILFKNHSYLIKLRIPEKGMTGMRDTVIAQKLLNEKKISIGEKGYDNWFRDPYDSSISEGRLMNQSEEKQYDSQFPNHPLTQVRELLDQLETNIEFGKELQKEKKFNV